MADPSSAVAVVFMSDLRLVSSVGALGAYGAWLSSRRGGAAALGRLALGVVLAATVGMLALAGATHMPFREWFLVAWVAVWLLASQAFNLTALGAPVAAGALMMIGWSYVAPSDWGGGGGAPLADIVRYWVTLRDGLAATGAACLGLAIASGAIRALVGDRRASRAYAPTDLVAVSGLLARCGGVLALLGLLASGLAWRYDTTDPVVHVVRSTGLVGLLAVSLAWLSRGRGKQEAGWQLALLALSGGAVCCWLFAGSRMAVYLTQGVGAP